MQGEYFRNRIYAIGSINDCSNKNDIKGTMTTETTDGKRDRQIWNGLYHVLRSRYNIKNTYKQRKILKM